MTRIKLLVVQMVDSVMKLLQQRRVAPPGAREAEARAEMSVIGATLQPMWNKDGNANLPIYIPTARLIIIAKRGVDRSFCLPRYTRMQRGAQN